MSNGDPTNKELLTELMVSVGRLDERQGNQSKAMGEKLDKMHEAFEGRLNNHSKRIRVVEGRQYRFAGIAAGAGAVLGALWDKISGGSA